jgi:hypothetical protein
MGGFGGLEISDVVSSLAGLDLGLPALMLFVPGNSKQSRNGPTLGHVVPLSQCGAVLSDAALTA